MGLGVNFSRGGMDVNGRGVGPTIESVRPPYGPNGAGVTGGEPLTRRERANVTTAAAAPAAASGSVVPGGPLVVIGGLLGIAGLLWLARKNSQYLQQNTIGFNTYNVAVMTLTSIVGIVLSKLAANKFPTFVTPVINAV